VAIEVKRRGGGSLNTRRGFARSPAFLTSVAASSSTSVRSGSDRESIEVLPLVALLGELERGLG
jgi:hypothetical protein